MFRFVFRLACVGALLTGVGHAVEPDTGDDGIPDGDELFPFVPKYGGDAMPDWWERMFLGGNGDPDADPDIDGVSNLYEYYCDTNPLSDDSDGDGLSNLLEFKLVLDPNLEDTNGTTRVGSGVRGYMDALRVWSTPLTGGKILSVYDQFAAFLPASFGGSGNLVAWYPFEDGQNTTIVNPLTGRIGSHGAEDYTRLLNWDFALTGVKFSATLYMDLPGDWDVDAGTIIERLVDADVGNYLLAIDAGRHLVAGYGTNRVGTKTNALGGFNGPYDVAVDTNGAVYVADHYNDRIRQRFYRVVAR